MPQPPDRSPDAPTATPGAAIGVPQRIGEVDGIVALSKPVGWVAHAAMARETHDLRAWCAMQLDLPRGLEPLHRLDRDTSGVLLYAADPAVRARVGAWFTSGATAGAATADADRPIHKTYLALVYGKAHRKGVIRTPLAPDHPGPPQDALTRYRAVEQLGGFTLLRVHPETGRKHQVRRHLHEIGHPIVGDERYRPKRFIAVPGFPNRLWLHAWKIELPGGIVFEAPLPPELVAHLEILRAGCTRPAV